MLEAHILAGLEFFTANPTGEVLRTILTVTMIDLVLSGDNAAVIALAARGLPPPIQKKAAAYGTALGIILQVVFTLLATHLMTIPYLTAMGGVTLLVITWKLLVDHDYGETTPPPEQAKAKKTFPEALCFIVLANLSMSFDNVLGVAGAADGNYLLVFCSLLLSIPLLILGSNWIGRLMTTFPPVVFIGGGILAHTAVNMICSDTALALGEKIAPLGGNALGWIIGGAIILYGCLIKPFLSAKKKQNQAKQNRT